MRCLAIISFGFLIGACSFSGNGDTSDASPDPDGIECISTATNVDTCQLAAPSATLTVNSDAVYDTDQGVFTVGGFPAPETATLPQPGGEMVRVIVVESFSVESSFVLRVVGSLPLAVVSAGDIDIEGAIDIGSVDIVVGAGGNSSACGDGTGASGADVGPGGGPGGGGGGYGAPGGVGAIGDNNGGNFPGAARGEAATRPTIIRGGCAGGAGGLSDDGNSGAGGAGGGALELVSATLIQVTGLVNAGGGGGFGGPAGGRGGGGGGGSGGYVGLEAPAIDITGAVTANGGGGGEGADLQSGDADDGDRGQGSAAQAAGGSGLASAGGEGGAGGALGSEAGVVGDDDVAGGGGGGGGVGYILVFNAAPSGGGTISPSATQVTP